MGLLDIQSSLVPLVSEALDIDAAGAYPLVRLWRDKQMARAAASNSLGMGRVSFRKCTRLGLNHMLARAGCNMNNAQMDRMISAWDRLIPWPDAREVIDECKLKGYSVALLSNGDQDQLNAINRAFGSVFDHVLSSETAGYYKPHPDVYGLTAKVLGIAKKDVLHVAGSGNDALGAEAFGMPCYWSNRTREVDMDPTYPPSFTGPDLTGLLNII